MIGLKRRVVTAIIFILWRLEMQSAKVCFMTGRRMLAINLLTVGLTLCLSHPSYSADKKAAQSGKTQTVEQPFLPCHGINTDVSKDSKTLVVVQRSTQSLTLIQDGDSKNQKQIILPREPYDVVLIDNGGKAVVSYGPWGELAVVDLKQGTVGAPFKAGSSAEGMCATSGGQLLVADPDESSVHLIDVVSQTKKADFKLKSKPKAMRWVVMDLIVEAADEKGKVIGSFRLPH